jgi:DNA polymerase III epsilon subunit family exonuclease
MSQCFVSFDLETTGLYPIKDKIVEIGAVRFACTDAPGKPKAAETFHTLVNPGMPIPQEVIAIHGITDDMVKNAPLENYAVESFLKFAGRDTLIAHNIAFDAGFIMAAVAQYKMAVPNNSLIDSCLLAKKFITGVENYKLETIGRRLNIRQTGYHRAMADAAVVMDVFRSIVNKLPPEVAVDSIPFLPEQSLQLHDFVFDKVELAPDKAILKKAVSSGFDVQIEYRNGKGEYSKRQVAPFNLYYFRGKGYLAAYCRQAQETRQFRIDRLVSVAKINNPKG